MSTAIPGLKKYIGKLTRPWIDGGYYTQTPENRPVIGPLPLAGTFITGAYSGFGIMAACGGGELIASHVLNLHLPEYAEAFAPSRYQNPSYMAKIHEYSKTGQL
jgi:glycine/D-amino acid oxidase-like deaminating enzyme